MTRSLSVSFVVLCAAAALGAALAADAPSTVSLGRELAVPAHLRDGQEFTASTKDLLTHGEALFKANWTIQDGAGRPKSKGTGRALTELSQLLIGPRAFNRVSAPDANSCMGCHNAPHNIAGGSGDFSTGVFVLGQRFDFSTFDPRDTLPTRGTMEETGEAVTLQDSANLRATTGMFGAGYLEMLAREMTEELQRTRDAMRLGDTKALVAKGVPFGTLTLKKDGLWDTSKVEGFGRVSLISNGTTNPPTLVIRPWHQASNVVSLREFTNTAFNQHHGIQSTERFGVDTDPDGDGVKNEMTRADVTAVAIWQATLQVPGRVIPRDPQLEQAVARGERAFEHVGCATCHIPKLPLGKNGHIFVEPNPFNPPGNLRTGDTHSVTVDLSSAALPAPRLAADAEGTIWVDAYTDLKLHNICGPSEGEPLDQNAAQWLAKKLGEGNCRFLTKRLWGLANEPPFFHHGLFTTLRRAILAHAGEAQASRAAFQALDKADQDGVIEFLKTLQVLPPGTKHRIVDETFQARDWPPSEARTPPILVTDRRSALGAERAVPRHLADGSELTLKLSELVQYGRMLFEANWTEQDGAGRPLSRGTGKPLGDATQRLTGSRAFNRVSGPDANACLGCHNAPYGAGGAGDFVTNAFEHAERFDFVTFDRRDKVATRGSLDERRRPATLQTVGNMRSTPDLMGAGYIELLATQITSELQRLRDSLKLGKSVALTTKGISFGRLARRKDGSFDTRLVDGLPPQSLAAGSGGKPSLRIRPWHQSGTVASLRDITITSLNKHHGIQASERFGIGTDPDGDGVRDEMTRADVTALTIFQASLPVPGHIIPRDAERERAIASGERLFAEIGCATCHIPSVPLDRNGWIYGDRALKVDLTDARLPTPRLVPSHATGTIDVPLYTDFKLHDITDPADASAAEAIDMNRPATSPAYLKGNRKFLTRRLWAVGSSPTHFHHGLLTTIRQAIEAHAGEALQTRHAFQRLDPQGQSAVIEFLKSLQALPPGSAARVVDEQLQRRSSPASLVAR